MGFRLFIFKKRLAAKYQIIKDNILNYSTIQLLKNQFFFNLS